LTVVVFPALSEPVRRAIFVPGVEVAAGTATVWLAGPDVTSLTVANTSAPTVPVLRTGRIERHLTVGGVASIAMLVAVGRSFCPASLILAA
jgi:hypothetical protein